MQLLNNSYLHCLFVRYAFFTIQYSIAVSVQSKCNNSYCKVICFTLLYRFKYVNALDGLSPHRLGLFYAVPTPTARNLLLSQHSFICISLSAFALFTL